MFLFVLIVGAKIQTISYSAKKLFHRLEVAGGVFAPRADEVGGELVAFIDVAADVADPFLFATCYLLSAICCRRLYVLLVVGVGDGGAVAEDAGL